jgi:hypothetical protein
MVSGIFPAMRPLVVWLACLGCLAGVWAAEPPAPAGAKPEGEALAAELRHQKPGQSLTNAGTLRVRDGKGRRREIPVTVTTLVGARDWQVIYRVQDGATGAVETLVVRQNGDERPLYELSRREAGSGTASPPRAVAAGASAVPFAGTDFWLCDLGLEFLHWPVQKVARQEMSNGRLCWALDSTNPGTNGYASVRSWIDVEFHALLRAEAYDGQRRKVKEFSTGNFKEITTADGNRMWFLKDIRIRDEFRDTRTDLIYQLPGD